jgi:hypothetical protein
MTVAASLGTPLERYRQSLLRLEKSEQPWQETDILALLTARDRLQIVLETQDAQPIPVEILCQVLELDRRFSQHGSAIAKTVDLEAWRSSFDPPEPSWWWYFSPPPNPHDRYDWLWSALTMATLAASVSVLVEISSRFLSGGIDMFGVFAVVGPSFMTLLTGGGAFTRLGRETIEAALVSVGLAKSWWHETKFALSLLLLIFLMVLYSFLPVISAIYDDLGLAAWQQGNFTSAESLYKRALSLDPENALAQFHVGRLYEDLGQLEQAEMAYRLATQNGLPQAFNYLARLYIIQDRPEMAVQLLLPREEEIFDPEQPPELRFAIAFNLGWARLTQGRYEEAEAYLKTAVVMAEHNDLESLGSAYCLLAQAVEAGEPGRPAALPLWEGCLEFGERMRSPEEDAWIRTAQERLNQPPTMPSPENLPAT